MAANEKEIIANGITYVCGVDEAGRGPLAGPVCAAAVILPEDIEIPGLNDSKKLSAKKREELSEKIKQTALCYSIVEIDEKTIDEMNILQATRLGMKRAIETLSIPPETVITDGNMTIDIPFLQRSVIHGDALCYSIGAASIIAKVHRDALMDEYAKKYPEYVKKISEHGHEIGTHSATHPHMSKLDKNAMVKELTTSKKVIEEIKDDF